MEGLAQPALRVLTVDAFTREPFSGNPAAVVFLQDDGDIKDETKQAIASEMKLSETAFVSKTEQHDDFDKCHGSNLTSAEPSSRIGHENCVTRTYVLVNNKSVNEYSDSPILRFTLCASEGKIGSASTEAPCVQALLERASWGEMQKALAVVGKLPICELRYSADEKKLLVRLDDRCTRAILEQFVPSPARMLQLETSGHIKGVTVTLKGDGERYDFMSRHFCPWYGIPEDPVTG
ncbi:unnamed protein product, partial [Ixodes persulcatus]